MRNAPTRFAMRLGWVLVGLALAQTSASGQSRAPSTEGSAATGRRGDASPGEVHDLPLVGGGAVRVLYAAPTPARAAIVMLPGGTGEVGIGDEGDLDHEKNFVLRTRAQWLKRGYAVIIPDAPGGRNMRGERSSPEFADLVRDLVRFAHSKVAGPVFLLGTSQGTIAAMNGASQLSKGQITGVVLTESVSRPGRKSRETVFDAAPDRVAVPVLVVANRDSRCRVAPASDARRVADAMTHSPEVKVLYLRGGELRSTDCGSQSPHGYWGIEDAVVDAIATWLDTHR
jgi:pimeloyl-ACP methyl ester carboxylesterase